MVDVYRPKCKQCGAGINNNNAMTRNGCQSCTYRGTNPNDKGYPGKDAIVPGDRSRNKNRNGKMFRHYDDNSS